MEPLTIETAAQEDNDVNTPDRDPQQTVDVSHSTDKVQIAFEFHHTSISYRRPLLFSIDQ